MAFLRDEGNTAWDNETLMMFVTGTGTGSSMHDLAGDFCSRSVAKCSVTGVKLSSEVGQCSGGIETDKS